MKVVYDIETYPQCFTLAARCVDAPFTWLFEISDYVDDTVALIQWVDWLRHNDGLMIGFNNVGFDYPVLHELLRTGRGNPHMLYTKAMEIIQAPDHDRFAHMVFPSDCYVPQLDLYKIHHFDNRAKATSLKAIEFNMGMDNISDLPFPVGSLLNREQVKVLREYNAHDVEATLRFYHKSLDMIRFREELTAKYGRDFTNHNDTKIGAEIFQMGLEKSGIQCYDYGSRGRTPRQTPRDSIALKDCIAPYIAFKNPEFERIREWFSQQVIRETRAAFKDVLATVAGLEYYFGTGGIHASVNNEAFIADEEMMILDIDVTSLYPSIAIENQLYPAHLGPQFVTTYARLKEQRVSYAKGTAENAMLKLALNGVYGKSNDKFSIFYDPLFTMRITITGQLTLAMLAERLVEVEGLRVIQANTDGITMYLPRSQRSMVDSICREWEQLTRLKLEDVEYSKMFIRDVNNYLCVHTDGQKTKRKGAYEWDVEWHQNASALVVQKVTELVLRDGAPIRETVMNWPNKHDFMMRVKVPRSSRLVITVGEEEYPLENTQRYYVSEGGGYLTKIMPPLAKNPDKWRRIGVESGWTVCPCNKIVDATLPINFQYYIEKIEKLCLGVM